MLNMPPTRLLLFLGSVIAGKRGHLHPHKKGQVANYFCSSPSAGQISCRCRAVPTKKKKRSCFYTGPEIQENTKNAQLQLSNPGRRGGGTLFSPIMAVMVIFFENKWTGSKMEMGRRGKKGRKEERGKGGENDVRMFRHTGQTCSPYLS